MHVRLTKSSGRKLLGSVVLLAVAAAAGRTYADVTANPERKVGLVLGCAGRLADGRRNPFLTDLLRTRPHFRGPRIQIGLAVFPRIGKGSPFFFRTRENGRP